MQVEKTDAWRVLTTPKKKERELFVEALDIASPVEREAWLREQCGSDARLFERVLKLFGAHEENDALLDAVAGPPRFSGEPNVTERSNESPPSTIGPYTVTDKLGEG
ncbi:MAG: hypothetical protein AAF492_06945, partial [Verrucomicrobiota bacterium]